ncbi:DUF6719 family protein [Antarcticirhabdus aurantiaca]|uniref:DUF6719 family protein n=1 Tax=Antarcticirhabdus aurantiaca TaxID=2606717 RepID=UPI0034E29F99
MVLASCQSTPRIVSSEPPAGTLATGTKVLVDDGSCEAGQILQVTGSTKGVPRKKECVPRPAN